MISISDNTKKFSSSLIIFGENLEPRLIDEIIGVKCTSSFSRGETFSKKQRRREYGMWCLERNDPQTSLTDDIRYFGSIIPNKYRPLINIKNVDSAKVLLWTDIEAMPSTVEISIDPDDVSLLSSLGVQVHFTQFFDERSEGASLNVDAL
jgi:hypothetical protein